MKKLTMFFIALAFLFSVGNLSHAIPLNVDGITLTLGGNLTYDYVKIINEGKIFVDPSFGWLNLVSTSYISIDSTSSIIGTKRSFNEGGTGGGGSTGGTNSNSASNGGSGGIGEPGIGTGGGGGSGGIAPSSFGAGGGGGSGGISPGIIVGDETSRTDYSLSGFGAGGGGGGAAGDGTDTSESGAAGSSGERGGATVRLEASQIEIRGDIEVNGGVGGSGGKGGKGHGSQMDMGGGGGGGAGASAGMIFLEGGIIDISDSVLSAIGGAGGNGGGPRGIWAGSGGVGEQGAGGRVKIFYSGNYFNTDTIFNMSGGVECMPYLEQLPAPIPEPTTMLLLGSGLICLAGFRRKIKNKRQ